MKMVDIDIIDRLLDSICEFRGNRVKDKYPTLLRISPKGAMELLTSDDRGCLRYYPKEDCYYFEGCRMEVDEYMDELYRFE